MLTDKAQSNVMRCDSHFTNEGSLGCIFSPEGLKVFLSVALESDLNQESHKQTSEPVKKSFLTTTN